MVGEYKRLGSAIIGWKMNTSTAFAILVRQYIPPPATIVDLCAGKQQLYRKMNGGKTIDGVDYKFIFGDIEKFPRLKYIRDIRNPPEELHGIADGFIFDPPWPSHSGTLKDMISQYSPMKKKEFPQFLNDCYSTINKVLKPKGILIIKISSPWNHMIYNSLTREGYKWLRDIPQLYKYKGILLTSYFMILRKQSCENMPCDSARGN